MRAGSLHRRIMIQRSTPDDSWDGAGLEVWSDLHSCWAEVRQQGGREFLTDLGVSAEVRRVFYIRWFAGIKPADRVVYDGVPHNIVEVREIGRRDGVELHALADPTQAVG